MASEWFLLYQSKCEECGQYYRGLLHCNFCGKRLCEYCSEKHIDEHTVSGAVENE